MPVGAGKAEKRRVRYWQRDIVVYSNLFMTSRPVKPLDPIFSGATAQNPNICIITYLSQDEPIRKERFYCFPV